MHPRVSWEGHLIAPKPEVPQHAYQTRLQESKWVVDSRAGRNQDANAGEEIGFCERSLIKHCGCEKTVEIFREVRNPGFLRHVGCEVGYHRVRLEDFAQDSSCFREIICEILLVKPEKRMAVLYFDGWWLLLVRP